MLSQLIKKISKMLLFGFPDVEITEASVTFKWLSNELVGGLIFFDKDPNGENGRNIIDPNQIRNLISQVKSLSREPIFLGIDQEGGKVARLNSANGFENFPSHYYLGERDDINLTSSFAEKLAVLLSSLGFNLNFAPVLDLNLNKSNQVISLKERSFGDTPRKVLSHAGVFIQRHRQRNILCVGKHFPGHGSSPLDTHKGWVDSTNNWQKIELEPYRMLIDKGILDAIMTAHILIASVDAKLPATLSNRWLDQTLRKELNFQGIIFSDDLQMKAIADNFSLEESIFYSISAGVDVLVFANMQTSMFIEPNEVISIIVDLIERKEITTFRIEESYRRIQSIKQKYFGMFNN